MLNQISADNRYKVGFFATLVILAIAAFFLFNSFAQQSANQTNKGIAMQFLKTAVETEEIAAFADEHFDQNIVLEFPPGFSFTPDHKNIVTGKESVKNAIAAWQAYSEQHIDFVYIVSENNYVAVCASQDRIFENYTGIPSYEDHPIAYFFYFENAKIAKIVVILDVLNTIEEFKK